MKRIAFLDYVRVFACFLVMLVHASENYYGAGGSLSNLFIKYQTLSNIRLLNTYISTPLI